MAGTCGFALIFRLLTPNMVAAKSCPNLPKDLVLYCGRHDYGTRVLQETGNLAAVMKTMGHKDVRTAMRYQHPELDIVREALNAQQTR